MFTDFIGNPINDGDTICFANGHGVMQVADVHKLIPLVPHRDGARSYGGPLMRADQANQADPTRYPKADAAKAYVIQVMERRRKNWHSDEWVMRKRSLSGNQVIVIPAGSRPA